MRVQLPATSSLAALAIMIGTFCCNYADAEQAPLYDWTVVVQTRQLERQFKYKRSSMEDQIYRLDVDYFRGDDETKEPSTAYETMWYHNDSPLGLERFNAFGVTQGQSVCIRIKHKTNAPTDREVQAAGNIIMRLWLEARLNQSGVTIIKVPEQSFAGIIEYLHSKGYSNTPSNDPAVLVNYPMRLHIESDVTGQSQLLHFS